MEKDTTTIRTCIVSTENLISQLPRTPAAPGIFKKNRPPSAVVVVVEAVKRTRKAAADLQQ